MIKVEKDLVRTQYVIMKILKNRKAFNHMRSMTLSEIAELEGRNKPNTLYKHLRILENKKLVMPGAKVERANGYFLSKEGLELLNKYDDMEEEHEKKY